MMKDFFLFIKLDFKSLLASIDQDYMYMDAHRWFITAPVSRLSWFSSFNLFVCLFLIKDAEMLYNLWFVLVICVRVRMIKGLLLFAMQTVRTVCLCVFRKHQTQINNTIDSLHFLR